VGEIGSNEGIAWVRPGDLATREGINRVMDQIQRTNPELFQKVISEIHRTAPVAISEP
jgi:hypothetical protein